MPRRGARRWIGVDGEGIGRNPHRYVMVCASDGRGNHDMIEDPRGLGTARVLDFFLSFATRDVRIAGYYLSYDWTMILKDLPNNLIYRLYRPELRALPQGEGGGFSPVRWRGYRLHWLSGMMRIAKGSKSITVWDIGKYYQAPFVKACEAWNVMTPEELERVRVMKTRRASFSDADREEVRRYCALECAALARLAAALEKAHDEAGLRPRGWYGPGATASVVLGNERIDERKGQIPVAVEHAASCAFFGGRFEQSALGRFNVQGWDIVSAYPFAAYNLPCLEHGRWKRVTSEKDLDGARHAVARWHLTDTGPVAWGPLPVRLPKGIIVYPRSGARGWAWLDEYRVARKYWKGVEWGGEAWVLQTTCSCRPFEILLELFRERVRGGGGRKIVLKYVLNSCYGKLAQLVGGGGRFASRVWAGMITSHTRAMLLRAIASHKDWSDVIAVATDGIYTRADWTPPPPPLAPDALGSWEASPRRNITFIRPGIYVADDSTVVRARGVGRAALAGRAGLDLTGAHVELGARAVFGGARQGVHVAAGRAKRAESYGQWRDVPIKVSLSPGPKRADDWSLVRLDGVESLPYTRHTRAQTSAKLELLRDSGVLRD